MGSLPVTPSVRSAQDLQQVNGIVVDPRNPKNVFAAGPAGIFYSNDGGLNWDARNNGLTPATFAALTLNPQKPDTLFAMTREGVLYRSDDSGKNWQAVKTNSS